MSPLSESLVVASRPYVGQWNHLVSTTNWEKGRIIAAWRESLAGDGLPATEYSDEAWARLVGGVTGQHVGRLRRVWQRFGESQGDFPGLFWSHFQAALDWNDAEMWLEGAVQNGWSVAQMREKRWETLGQVEAERPQAGDVVVSETDEDFEPARTTEPVPHAISGAVGEVQGPRHDGPDFGDASPASPNSSAADWDSSTGETEPAVELIKPFEHLPDLPDDLSEAFDAMKLAILRHKTDDWRQVAATDVSHALDALKALVIAPSAETAPF
ncbi:MAG: hypothetical protein SFU86_17295 [Pirellulaceae bacterium]|nr:hypothetical protein [Pirellulaceae bacterium]